jgi:hypothetical protein
VTQGLVQSADAHYGTIYSGDLLVTFSAMFRVRFGTYLGCLARHLVFEQNVSTFGRLGHQLGDILSLALYSCQ